MSNYNSFILHCGHLKAHSVIQYQSTLGSLAQRYPGQDVDSLPEDDVLFFLKQSIVTRNGKTISKPRSASSYNSVLVILKKYYKFAGRKAANGDPFLAGIKVRGTQKKPLTITEADIQYMVEACRNPRDVAILAVLKDTGMRAGEIVSITVGGTEVTPDGVTFTVLDSKSQPRKVWGKRCVADVANWLNHHPARDNQQAPLFCMLYNTTTVGRAMKPSEIKDVFVDIEARARKIHPHMNHVHAHSLRHWDITMEHRRGTDMLTNMKLHGHHSLEMIQTYVECDNADAIAIKQQKEGVIPASQLVQKPTAVSCPRCHMANDAAKAYCAVCGTPLDVKAAQKIEKAVDDGDAIIAKIQSDPKFRAALKAVLLGQ